VPAGIDKTTGFRHQVADPEQHRVCGDRPSVGLPISKSHIFRMVSLKRIAIQLLGSGLA
jgi:hypothetical protein